MSTKTLLSAAANALPVRFTFSQDWIVTGFLCGIDNFHVKVVEPSGEVHLIHKTHAMVTVLEGETPWTELEDETDRARIEAIAAPFRQWSKDQTKKPQGATPC